MLQLLRGVAVVGHGERPHGERERAGVFRPEGEGAEPEEEGAEPEGYWSCRRVRDKKELVSLAVYKWLKTYIFE